MDVQTAAPRRFDGILVEMWSVPVTALVCVTAIALSLWGWATPGFEPLLLDGRAFRGEPWRLLSAHFLHGDAVHLLLNLYWTWTFGRMLEPRLGRMRLALLILYLALGVSLACHAFDRGGVGLSGIGYGLWAFLAVGGRRAPTLRGLVDRRTNALFVAWFFLCILLTITDVWLISNWGHATGAVLGALVALGIESDLRFKVARGSALLAVLPALLVCATWARTRVNLGAGAVIDAYEAHAALVAEDWETARERCESALALDPSDRGVWWNLAAAHAGGGDHRAAADAAWRSFELGYRDKDAARWLVDALLNLIATALEADQLDVALVDARRAVEASTLAGTDRMQKAWWDLACVHARLEARRESVDAGLRAYDLGRKDAATVEWLSHTLALVIADEIDAQRFDLALAYARRGVEIAPESKPLWENVRSTAERAGDTVWAERARSELARLGAASK